MARWIEDLGGCRTVSGIEPPGPERRRETDIRGRASDSGHVYQAQNNQYITHVHLYGEADCDAQELAQTERRGTALESTQERVTLLIRRLSFAQAELQARCVELEEEARRARADGRAEALAEMREQLQAAELRVMKTQEVMRAAVREREKAEALLARAQEELALRRRAEERRERQLARADARASAEAEPASTVATPQEESEQFAEFVERAEEQLGQVRDDLRMLGQEFSGQDPSSAAARVVEGQVVQQPHESRGEAPQRATPAPGNPKAGQKKKRSGSPPKDNGEASVPSPVPRERARVVGEPRWFRIGVVWLCCLIPPWAPAILVTANRAAYASDAPSGKTTWFMIVTVLVGVLVSFALGLALKMMLDQLDRDSEIASRDLGRTGALLGAGCVFIAALFSPHSWLGPLGTWGKAFAVAMGLG
ncbi:hypothetical protein ACWDBW_16715 [Streptomyces sp. NPDC001107]